MYPIHYNQIVQRLLYDNPDATKQQAEQRIAYMIKDRGIIEVNRDWFVEGPSWDGDTTGSGSYEGDYDDGSGGPVSMEEYFSRPMHRDPF